jgi:hypothetical protein
MAKPTITELLEAARANTEPIIVSELGINPGGVDPLGLRQINFQLMDLVFPGLNNVACHIRPYTLIAWAWKRAAHRAKAEGHRSIGLDTLQDFVDRMEVLFAWSQFLIDPAADLPGRDFLSPLLHKPSHRFGDAAWKSLCEKRRYSTALSAPVNYGPAVKTLGWLIPADDGAFVASETLSLALAAFEGKLGDLINEPIFNQIGKTVDVSRDIATQVGEAWSMLLPTNEERTAMLMTLTTSARQAALESSSVCLQENVTFRRGAISIDTIRTDLCGDPSPFTASKANAAVVEKWRVVQLRQLFRLALEALLHWVTLVIHNAGRGLSTKELVLILIEESGSAPNIKDWLRPEQFGSASIPERIDRLQRALHELSNTKALARAVREALAFSLCEDRPDLVIQDRERLPISIARDETVSLSDVALHGSLSHILDAWIFGQHVYWAVSRGLGDARGQGKTILRLKVVQELQRWRLAPGINLRSFPRATPDRLETAVTLLAESGGFA